jgi:uroporphyrinogen III methyltransferase / synthase
MINVLLSPAEGASELAKRLDTRGVRTITWPQLRIHEFESAPLDEAVDNLFGYDWVILKNAAAAKFFLQRFRELQRAIDELDNLRFCVIGDEAAEIIREARVHLDLPVDRFPVERAPAAILSYLGGADFISGLNILIPSANVTRAGFDHELESLGARVDAIAAYRTTDETSLLTQVKGLLAGGGIDWVLFTRPSDVEELAQVFDTDDLAKLLPGVSVACFDQVTNKAAGTFGLTSVASPEDPSAEAFQKLITPSVGLR